MEDRLFRWRAVEDDGAWSVLQGCLTLFFSSLEDHDRIGTVVY